MQSQGLGHGSSVTFWLPKPTHGRFRIAAIALTSFTREQDRALALTCGFDAHCAKPLNLVQQILTLLGIDAGKDARESVMLSVG